MPSNKEINLYARYQDPLVALLSLHSYPRQEPDWEWVVSDPARVEEFMVFYQENRLNDHDRLSLMEIILDSYNRRVWDGAADPAIWKEIAVLLKADLCFFRECILYWSNTDYSDSEMEDAFAIAPGMRQLFRLAHARGLLADIDSSDWCDDVVSAVCS